MLKWLFLVKEEGEETKIPNAASRVRKVNLYGENLAISRGLSHNLFLCEIINSKKKVGKIFFFFCNVSHGLKLCEKLCGTKQIFFPANNVSKFFHLPFHMVIICVKIFSISRGFYLREKPQENKQKNPPPTYFFTWFALYFLMIFHTAFLVASKAA